jgi:hypothetical protein
MKILRESRGQGRELTQRRCHHGLRSSNIAARTTLRVWWTRRLLQIIHHQSATNMPSSNDTNGKRPRSFFYVHLIHSLESDRAMEGRSFIDFELRSLL